MSDGFKVFSEALIEENINSGVDLATLSLELESGLPRSQGCRFYGSSSSPWPHTAVSEVSFILLTNICWFHCLLTLTIFPL